jgi:tetratricopeptide (TPR) repeat protein
MKTIFIAPLIVLTFSFCNSNTSNSQGKTDCRKFNNQAMDSLLSYNTSFSKRNSTLEFALNLLNEALKCDSSMSIAKFNKVTVLNGLGKYAESISLLNELIRSRSDSSLVLLKAPLYEKINKHDSLTITYNLALRYFIGKNREKPHDDYTIYGLLLCKSKLYGIRSVQHEIDSCLGKYPANSNLRALLEDIK